MIAIIGGSGFYDFIENSEERKIDTPFGEVQFDFGKIMDKEVIFIPRHGKKHNIAPSSINYRGNIYAAFKLGAECVITTNAVGSMRDNMIPGSLIIPDQILDFTSGRKNTFFDGSDFSMTTKKRKALKGVIHTDVTYPYDIELREKILDASKNLKLKVIDGGCMTVYNGPRYETPAEMRMAKILGGDLAGMTSAPEAFLAKEIELPYATIAVVTNFVAGLQEKVSHEEVEEVFKKNIDKIKLLFSSIIDNY